MVSWEARNPEFFPLGKESFSLFLTRPFDLPVDAFKSSRPSFSAQDIILYTVLTAEFPL